MQIEEQIKTLLRVKAKIDLYKALLENLQTEASAANKDAETNKFAQENPGLLGEFVAEVVAFGSARIEELGNGGRKNAAPPTPVQEAPAVKPVPAPTPEDSEPKDPLKFLLKYRHLDNKRVTFQSKDGTVTGTVRGLVTPFIRVETDSGFVINVEPKLIALEA